MKTPLIESFVAHFGEMGSRWGINRSVSQVYALLFVYERPLHADELSEMLGISRSNVSMSIKELQAWQVIRIKRYQGDRREYFTTIGSVWDIFKAIAAERRRREVEPTMSMLRQAMLEDPDNDLDIHAQKRMREMYDIADLANNWFDELQHLQPDTMRKLMKLGGKVVRLFGDKDVA